LGINHQGKTTNIVMYGPAGSHASLLLNTKGKVESLNNTKPFHVRKGRADLDIQFNKDRPMVYGFKIGDNDIRLITVNTDLADRTWFMDDLGKHYIITGPEYVAGIQQNLSKKGLKIEVEHYWK
jgi:hypothetical protein